jgi:hypothetical protein
MRIPIFFGQVRVMVSLFDFAFDFASVSDRTSETWRLIFCVAKVWRKV